MTTNRDHARRLSRESLNRGDPVGWFDELYSVADGDPSFVPWADMTVNPHFTEWCNLRSLNGAGQRALVVGCGLGDDAEALSKLGFDVVAFDVSPAAISWCRRRFSETTVEYCETDLFAYPEEWTAAFDFVLEVYTVQALPDPVQSEAIAHIARLVAESGTLLVVTRGRDATDDLGDLPWPLTKSRLGLFQESGLKEVRFEDFVDDENPPVRRFRIEYRRG